MSARRTTLHPIHQLREEMDRLFSTFFTRPGVAATVRSLADRGFPAVNTWEDGDNVYVEAELPGLKGDELEISVVGSELTLRGQRSPGDESTPYHRRERGTGPFSRVVELPAPVDADAVSASLDSGVLLVTLPKSADAKPRKIQVRTAVN
jgi:HSP20 family protein